MPVSKSAISRRDCSDFIWEVLFQGKVIVQRPVAGAAHAFVFWGFLAFGLITVNHIASGFGLPLLSRESGFGKVVFWGGGRLRIAGGDLHNCIWLCDGSF